MSKIKIPNIIGMPPSTYVSDAIMHNSIPVLEIVPGIPSRTDSMTSFVMTPLLTEKNGYLDTLKQYGYEFDDGNVDAIRFAFVPDNFPSDTFTTEYTENFLQKMTEVASEGLGQLAQMTGQRRFTNTVSEVANVLNQFGTAGQAAAGGIQEAVSTVQGGIKKLQSGPKGSFQRQLGSIASMADVLLAGGRADFPQLWRNSSYSPSYSFTVRLYNPAPGNDMATHRYIVGPIAALMLLALPQAVEAGLYSWPYIHDIRCRGLFSLNPCYINSINIIKGGDQLQVGWNQRVGAVDIRIDVTSLFSTIVAESGKVKPNTFKNRPTLARYLESITDSKDIENVDGSPNAPVSEQSQPPLEANQATNNKDMTSPTEGRVSTEDKSLYNSLKSF